MNEPLRDDKSNKRTEDTIRITKKKLDQPDNTRPTKLMPPPSKKQKLNPNNNKLQASLLSLPNPAIPH